MRAIRITQLDGKLPNLALMRIAAWHREIGDLVHYTRSAARQLGEPDYAKVYGSAIFKFSAGRVERFLTEWPEATIGGTGTDRALTVEQIPGFFDCGVDYSMYPKFDASIGFTQRGCRLKCKFCVVPGKEGKPKSEATVSQIWRGEPYPKHLHLLDNDFFGNPDWRERIEEIRRLAFKVSFTQGINIRMVTDEVAEALSQIEYRDDGFSRRRLYTAWDNRKDEKVFFRGVDTLERHGIPPKHLMAYMLIGFDPRETWELIFHRFDKMVERGILPYPMVFDQSRQDLKRFQRWVLRGLYRAGIPFAEYTTTRRRPDARQVEMFP